MYGLTYDSRGFLIGLLSEQGETLVAWEIDDQDNLTRVTNASGVFESYEYSTSSSGLLPLWGEERSKGGVSIIAIDLHPTVIHPPVTVMTSALRVVAALTHAWNHASIIVRQADADVDYTYCRLNTVSLCKEDFDFLLMDRVDALVALCVLAPDTPGCGPPYPSGLSGAIVEHSEQRDDEHERCDEVTFGEYPQFCFSDLSELTGAELADLDLATCPYLNELRHWVVDPGSLNYDNRGVRGLWV